jgi:hypothetical protein
VSKTGTDWLRIQARRIGPGQQLPDADASAACLEVERWLQRHSVAYAPPTQIPLALIDERRSRANQARRDAIVTDSVDRFALAMREGAIFPPVVAYPNGTKVTLVDGNNREAAARKNGYESVLGIIVAGDTPSELIQLLTVEANAHHGVTPDLAWRLQQAHHLVSLGFADEQAAEAACLTVNALRADRMVLQADARAKALKIAAFTSLSSSARRALQALRDDPVFYQAAQVALTTGMTTDEVRSLVREVKTLPSEGARIERIGGVARERGIEAATKKATGKAANRISSPKTSLATAIGMLLRVDEASLIRQILTIHDRDLVNARLKQLEEKTLSLQVAMETLDRLEA